MSARKQMSPNGGEQGGDTARRLISLCKEFTAFMRSAKTDAEKFYELADGLHTAGSPNRPAMDKDALNTRYRALQDKINSMQLAINDLVRAASQQIEHSDLEFADKVELKLRLAELEAQKTEVQALIWGQPAFTR
jgi:hypothetical protein